MELTLVDDETLEDAEFNPPTTLANEFPEPKEIRREIAKAQLKADRLAIQALREKLLGKAWYSKPIREELTISTADFKAVFSEILGGKP